MTVYEMHALEDNLGDSAVPKIFRNIGSMAANLKKKLYICTWKHGGSNVFYIYIYIYLFIYLFIYFDANKNTKQGNMAILSASTDPHKQSSFSFFNGKWE